MKLNLLERAQELQRRVFDGPAPSTAAAHFRRAADLATMAVLPDKAFLGAVNRAAKSEDRGRLFSFGAGVVGAIVGAGLDIAESVFMFGDAVRHVMLGFSAGSGAERTTAAAEGDQTHEERSDEAHAAAAPHVDAPADAERRETSAPVEGDPIPPPIREASGLPEEVDGAPIAAPAKRKPGRPQIPSETLVKDVKTLRARMPEIVRAFPEMQVGELRDLFGGRTVRQIGQLRKAERAVCLGLSPPIANGLMGAQGAILGANP